MKIGLVSAILADYGFEKMVDTVSELGFDCVEVACWPCGKAERRYAGDVYKRQPSSSDAPSAEPLLGRAST